MKQIICCHNDGLVIWGENNREGDKGSKEEEQETREIEYETILVASKSQKLEAFNNAHLCCAHC